MHYEDIRARKHHTIFVEGMSDEFPDFDTAEDYLRDPPPMAEELIKGVLRCGHKIFFRLFSAEDRSASMSGISP